jgi:hypothetical protein
VLASINLVKKEAKSSSFRVSPQSAIIFPVAIFIAAINVCVPFHLYSNSLVIGLPSDIGKSSAILSSACIPVISSMLKAISSWV